MEAMFEDLALEPHAAPTEPEGAARYATAPVIGRALGVGISDFSLAGSLPPSALPPSSPEVGSRYITSMEERTDLRHLMWPPPPWSTRAAISSASTSARPQP